MRITPEDVLRAVRELGPVVPNKIKQRLGESDSMLINIYLSDLQKEGKVRTTTLQLGSSSFAYTPEQLPKLEALTEHLNEKDKRVAIQLKTQSVMRAAAQDPLTRVGLQTIKDFAKPIQVKTGEGEETFYRWYSVSSEQAQEQIRQLLGVHIPQPVKQQPEPQPAQTPNATSTQPATLEKQPSLQPKSAEPPKQETKKAVEKQQPLTQIETESAFGKQLTQYFTEKRITVKQFEEVRKNSEIDAIINVPTAVGEITYFCKAKSKKTSNDGDLAAAILTAKSKMLPALYLTTGTVTKKARENKELQEITVVELGNSNH